jgi:branched-chain amino acid transport system permease protein
MEWLQTAIDAVSLGSLYALYTIGIALIFGIMNLINFAHGEFIMGGQYAIVVFVGLGVFMPALLPLAIIVAVVLALVSERVAFRPVRGASLATLLVTSFAISYLLQNVAAMLFSSVPRTVNVAPSLTESFAVGDIHVVKLDLITIGTVVVTLAALSLFLRKTTLGVQMRAAAEDFEMARMLRVRANRVIGLAFALSGTFAAIASFLLIVRVGFASPTSGVTPVLYAFIATVLGGLGSLVGPVLGAFVLGVLTVVLQVVLPEDLLPYRDAMVFAVVFAILVLRPDGLVVSRSRFVRV